MKLEDKVENNLDLESAPNPEAEVEDAFEDGGESLSAVERPPQAEQHDVYRGQRIEERVRVAGQAAGTAREDRDEVVQRKRERVELHGSFVILRSPTLSSVRRRLPTIHHHQTSPWTACILPGDTSRRVPSPFAT